MATSRADSDTTSAGRPRREPGPTTRVEQGDRAPAATAGRLRLEAQLELANRCLSAAMRHAQLRPLLAEFVSIIKEVAGCDAVGVRLVDPEGNIPYEAYEGFSTAFYELESPLSMHSDHCMCISVIAGRTDPSLPYFTPRGSFFANATSRLLATTSEEERGQTRNACNAQGYESVALVPLRFGTEILGLVHVAALHEDQVPLPLVETLEGAAQQLAMAIRRVRGDDELRRAHEELERRVTERTAELERSNLDLSRATALHRAIAATSPDGIAVLDADGTLSYANQALAALLGRERPQELEGVSVVALMASEERDRTQFNLLKALSRGRGRARYRMLHRDGEVIPVEINAARVDEGGGAPQRLVAIVRDIRARNASEARIERNTRLLAAIRAAQARFIAGKDRGETWNRLLRILVDLTDSEYGFIDEIRTDADGTPYKRSLALSDISWDEDSRALYKELSEVDFEFRNLNTLAAAPAMTGQVVVSNDPARDPRSGGVPPGHPEIRSFLGLPLRSGGELVGIAGVANRDGGYDASVASFLEPFTVTCGLLIHAQRAQQLQHETMEELAASENRLAEAFRQLETLLREVHHRVKNNLQVISSMLRLRSREVGDDARLVLKECEQRVRAMALIHEHLLRSDHPGRVDLEQYLGRLVRDLGQLYRRSGGNVTITVDAEPVDLDFESALPLALALNELVANALRHAFPDGGGELYLDAGISREGALQICVADTGVGLPEELDWRHSKTAGLSMVVDLVESQLGGSISLHRACGTRFELALPAKLTRSTPREDP